MDAHGAITMTTHGGEPQRIAVIGSGIAGLSSAWLLSSRHHVTVYEAADRLGGHSNTIDVQTTAGRVAVDTGFIVYNEATYPNLTALLQHLGVVTQPSCMSFGVSLDGGRLEYAGTDLRSLFAQKRNLLRPRFWSMLRDLVRFYKVAPLDGPSLDDGVCSLGTYLDQNKFGKALQQDHLLPMAAAIWSAPATAMRDYPAAAFISFCENHGLLKIADRPIWRTVTGGSRNTVNALAAGISGQVLLGRRVVGVQRDEEGVTIRDATGAVSRFHQIVIATHGDQARAILEDPSQAESDILGAFHTSRNYAVLHTDASLMPRRRGVWSSWNYLSARGGKGQSHANEAAPCVTYWMNRLQRLPGQYIFLTLNPHISPLPETILHSQHYEHPMFDAAAIAAQRAVWSLQGARRTWFCGAHFGAGFHEDGLQAGLAVAEALGGVRRPWSVANESGRIKLGTARTAPLPEPELVLSS
jgi:predicted NAD/FAD-binding protein